MLLNQPNTNNPGIHSLCRIEDVFDTIESNEIVHIYDGGFGFTVCSNDVGHVTLLGCKETREVADALVHCAGQVALGFDTIVTVQSLQNGSFHRVDVFRYSDGGMYGWFSHSLPTTSPLKVRQVAAGMKHVLVLTEDGVVFEIHKETVVTERKDIPGNVKLIACGADHSAVVNQQGHLYTWGSNLRGQCGRGYSGADIIAPDQVLHAVQVTSIACGLHFTVCCSCLGDVYSWGTSQDGAHGHDTSTLYTPTLLEYFGEDSGMMAVQVCSGSSHTLVRTDSGVVYGFGNNEFGQTGTRMGTTSVPHPVTCDSIDKRTPCVDIRTGWWHSLFKYA
jgi:hypothetical protein